MELVLLLAAATAEGAAKVQTWRDTCEAHGFDCVVWTQWSDRLLEAHPWDRTYVVALLDANAVTEWRIDTIRRHATEALLVLSGQEAGLLAWCRRRLGERPSVQARPRPRGTVNVTERTLAVDGELLRLQPREARLLAILARFAGTTCQTDAACRELLGGADAAKRRLLRQYLYQLRQKLGRHARLLQHVPGEGYRCLLELQLVELA